jgi:multidrug efflux pump subunit AcrB
MFVEVSIREVVKTLGEAMLLVFLVVFVFLQSWRATIIPFAAVPCRSSAPSPACSCSAIPSTR